MPNRTQSSNVALANMVDPAVQIINNTTVAGAAMDLQGVDAAYVAAQIGVWGDTVAGGLIEIGLQHSDDTVAGNFTDCAAADLTDTVSGASTVTGAIATGVFATVSATTNDQKVVKTSYRGSKRYIRVKINGEKNLATGTPIAVLLVKGNLNNAPSA